MFLFYGTSLVAGGKTKKRGKQPEKFDHSILVLIFVLGINKFNKFKGLNRGRLVGFLFDREAVMPQQCRVYCCSCLVYVLLSYVYLLYYVCIAVFFLTLDAGLLARSQYSEGPATGHLDTGFCLFPCVYKQMLRWFPRFQVATTCFSCSPPDLNSVVLFCIHVK